MLLPLNLTLTLPLPARTQVTDWERLEKVWTYGFMRSGFNGYDQRIPVGMVTSMASFSERNKDLTKMAELLFEVRCRTV